MTASKAQYARIKPELDAAFSVVMQNMSVEGGPQVAQFAQSLQQFVPVSHAIPCAGAAVALRLALLALDLPAGAGVLLPAFGDKQLPELVQALGLTPVFADVDPRTFALDADRVAAYLSPETAAIVCVHPFGQAAPAEHLRALAEERGLWLIEDCSQSFGAKYTGANGQVQRVSTAGHISYTSFFAAKPLLNAGEGGAVLTNDDALAARVQQLLQQGRSEVRNKTLPALEAALLDVKLQHLDAFNQEKERVVAYYTNAFAHIPAIITPSTKPVAPHTHQVFTIKVPAPLRNGLQQYLQQHYIPSVVYYPDALPLLYNSERGAYPVAEALCQQVLALPLHPELKEDQLAYICQDVVNYVKQG